MFHCAPLDTKIHRPYIMVQLWAFLCLHISKRILPCFRSVLNHKSCVPFYFVIMNEQMDVPYQTFNQGYDYQMMLTPFEDVLNDGVIWTADTSLALRWAVLSTTPAQSNSCVCATLINTVLHTHASMPLGRGLSSLYSSYTSLYKLWRLGWNIWTAAHTGFFVYDAQFTNYNAALFLLAQLRMLSTLNWPWKCVPNLDQEGCSRTWVCFIFSV